jgi:hypothetical protein
VPMFWKKRGQFLTLLWLMNNEQQNEFPEEA